ncbi:MAG: hypothetical protein CME71_09495 [Halobacteriovorax sp.]|nr:hypothetical protein [Halobacteriovorax sp.]
MKSLSLFLLFSIVSSMLLASEPVFIQERKLERIIRLDINSSINPATYSYLQAGFEEARKEDFQAILITLNTPGGLVSVTKDILTLFGDSELPVIVWIRPEGASATSAGAIIAAGAHLLYMSDGTNIGAATPIEMSGDIKQADARSKAINDLVALVQSLAETRQRNATLFAEMIEKASSFKSKEAKEKKLIDDIVNTTSELKQKINGSEFKIKGQRVRLSAEGTEIISFGMDLGQKLLDILANPSTAYILFILGAGLIYLELQAPGGFVAGSIGAVSLLLAGIGFQILPLNFGAFGLIILAFVLLLMEIYITSYGVLTLAGLASLITGSLFLFRSDDAYLHLSHSVIFSTVAGIAAFVALIGYVIYRDHKHKHETSFNDMAGKEGVVLKVLGDELYQIKVSGEVWKAQGPKGLVLEQKVNVLEQSQDEMMVKIQSKS